MKFKKKPVEIEAIQWKGDNINEIWDAFTAEHIYGPTEKNPDFLVLNTTEGPMNCPVGWWVIKGVEGEIYSCKDSVFKTTYEQIDW